MITEKTLFLTKPSCLPPTYELIGIYSYHLPFSIGCSSNAMRLLKKYLQNYRISYHEMHAVLFEAEMINNRPLTYVYPDK